jgi:flagellar biosynthesis/type III secretory pathway M-ring protein FliF/YscJ
MQNQNIPTYLPQAILTTLFCCLPFGIVAIVYAAQVSSKQQMGDYEGAMQASNNAKLWCWLSVGAYLAVVVVYVLLVIVASVAQSA